MKQKQNDENNMKRLLLLIGILVGLHQVQGQYLWLSDTVYLDYPIMATGDLSIRPLFDGEGDKYMAEGGDGFTYAMKKAQKGTTFNINEDGYLFFVQDHSGAFNVKKLLETVTDFLAFNGIDFPTPYGTPTVGRKIAAGAHVINAWEKDKLHYRGNWKVPESTSTGCKCAFSNVKGDYIEVTFKANSVKIISEKVSTHGKVSVTLDRNIVKTEDLRSDSTINPYVLFEVKGLSDGWHTIRMTVEEEERYAVLHRIEIMNTTATEDSVPIDLTDDVLISEHSTLHKAFESVTGVEIVQKGTYQVYQDPEGKRYIVQPILK